MNMFARFDENPAMTLPVIKETKRYEQTHARTDNMKTVYPPQTKFATLTFVNNVSKYMQQTTLSGCIFAGTLRVKSSKA